MSKLSSLLIELQSAAEMELKAAGQEVAAKVIVNGDIAWDDRCGGYLYVRNAGAVGLGGDATCITPFIAYTIYVGLLRCVTVFSGEEGEPPSTDVLTEEALEVIADSEAIYRAITCDIDWSAYDKNKRIVGWTALTPDGGFAGGEWQIEVRFIG